MRVFNVKELAMSVNPRGLTRGAGLHFQYNALSEYELFECRPDGSIIWVGASRLERVCEELSTRVEATGKQYFAMQLRTRKVIFPADAPAIGKRVFQIAYTPSLCTKRERFLRGRGYGVLSVIGNDAARALLTALQTHASEISYFVVGHAAPKTDRKEMVDWLRSRYGKVAILVLNPPGQRTPGADHNVPENGPEPLLPITNSVPELAAVPAPDPPLTYSWQRAVSDALTEVHPDRLLIKFALAQRAISARLCDSHPTELRESIALREALRALRAVTPDRSEKKEGFAPNQEIARASALDMTIEELQKQNTSRIQAEDELRETQRSVRELSVDLLRAQDEERRRISQELHDGLGQCLVALRLDLHLVGQAIPPAERVTNPYFAECLELCAQALSQIRALSHLMYPAALQQGLASAILSFVHGFEERCGIQTEVEIPRNLARFSPEVELTLFRILQESLINIYRHSGSRTAEVGLQAVNGAVVLKVKDSGKGLRSGAGGIGLRSMQRRAEQLKGTLAISSGPDGTTVTATLPCHRQLIPIAVSTQQGPA